jgi:hypothetical protein
LRRRSGWSGTRSGTPSARGHPCPGTWPPADSIGRTRVSPRSTGRPCRPPQWEPGRGRPGRRPGQASYHPTVHIGNYFSTAADQVDLEGRLEGDR